MVYPVNEFTVLYSLGYWSINRTIAAAGGGTHMHKCKHNITDSCCLSCSFRFSLSAWFSLATNSTRCASSLQATGIDNESSESCHSRYTSNMLIWHWKTHYMRWPPLDLLESTLSWWRPTWQKHPVPLNFCYVNLLKGLPLIKLLLVLVV